MRHVLIGAAVLLGVLLLARSGYPQADIDLSPSYLLRASWQADYTEVCFFHRTTELGCSTAPEPALHSSGVQYVEVLATLTDPGHLVHVRAYAKSATGESADSPNAFRVGVSNTVARPEALP